MDKQSPIGFFDSGVGGISVLKESLKLLPQENYIYLGDSKNAPYGSKSLEEIKRLSLEAVDFLYKKNCKAVVIACNTATSAAISDLRSKYGDYIIIGTEPALKPAIKETKEGSVLVLATPRTLAEEKFRKLMESVAIEREVIKMPLPGIVELIEAGHSKDELSYNYLKNAFRNLNTEKISAVVLGCTHYPFVIDQIRKLLKDIPVYDGAKGIARHLKEELQKKDLLNDHSLKGSLKIYNTSERSDLYDLTNHLLYD